MANSNNTIEVVEVFTRSRRVIPIPWMERIPQRNLTLIAFTLRYEISASQMIANTARSAPKIMHVHCSQGDKLYQRRNLSGLKRFPMDKLFKLKQVSVIKRFLTDKHKIPQLRET